MGESLAAELLVYSGLYLVVKISQACPAGSAVAVFSSNHGVRQGIDIWRGRRRSCSEFFVDSALHGVVESAQACASLVSVAVFTTDNCVG